MKAVELNFDAVVTSGNFNVEGQEYRENRRGGVYHSIGAKPDLGHAYFVGLSRAPLAATGGSAGPTAGGMTSLFNSISFESRLTRTLK